MSDPIALTLPTAADTRRLGERLAPLLQAGDLVVLDGPLGAGKTVVVQGLGAGLGVRGPVTSPTFVLARTYPGGRLPLVHVDAYRLGGALELDDLDLDTDVASSVTAVEWGSGLAERLTDAHLSITLTRSADDDCRTATLTAIGSWTERWPAVVAACSQS